MRFIKQPPDDFWWQVVNACDYATFFHTPIWRDLILKTYPQYFDATLGLEWTDSRRAVVPLLAHIHKQIAQSKFSTYASCYGGLVATESVADEERARIWQQLWRGQTFKLTVHGNPIAPRPFVAEPNRNREDFTHILMLDKGFETLYRKFSKGHRSSTTKGRRMGVTVEIASNLDDYRVYYGAYEDSLRRWGDRASSHYPWELFENGFHLAQTYPENIKLWVAKVDGRVIAGAWVFYWNQHVDWWHGASYEEFFDHCANNVLQAAIIEDAVVNGYKYYDFNPSGGHKGVEKFKKNFNAQPVEFGRFQKESRLVEAIRPFLRKS